MQAIEQMREVAETGDGRKQAPRDALKAWAAELLENNTGHILKAGLEAVRACAEYLNAYDPERDGGEVK